MAIMYVKDQFWVDIVAHPSDKQSPLRHPREVKLGTQFLAILRSTHNLRKLFAYKYGIVYLYTLQSLTKNPFCYETYTDTSVYIQYSTSIRILGTNARYFVESNKTVANVTTFVRCSSHPFRRRFIPREIPQWQNNAQCKAFNPPLT